MDKAYDPAGMEQRIYAMWESGEGFAPRGEGSPYCIMIPPPNVTGTLHMGHAFQDTIMDALVRYHRMQGHASLWQPGTDHAGIATQMVVERQLAAEGSSRQALGRDAFVERVWQWKEQSGGTITRQLRRLGASVDWSRERFTMDPEMTRAVIEVFVRLHEEGLIYRGKRLVNWDPVLHTAISDLEVLATEQAGHLWHFRYPLADAQGHLVVATTRPETMLGDTAVAVHPQDERFAHLVGQQIRLPLTGRLIPIIADDYVDPEFGSGCVKITPAHDFNDYEVGTRHALPLINIFDENACINDQAPEAYRGLDRFEARRRVVADLDSLGLVERIDEHRLMVPHGDRSGAVIEPWLTDQWYVRIAPLAEPAIRAVEDGRIRFVPENWNKTYFEWMRNIQDWCISRQLWWGHRIPAWYDDAGGVYVGRTEAEVRERHGLGADTALRQDEDVLDTWFSSALWPFSTLGWPDDTDALRRFYPGNVLVTGFDIIFFWVARMIMMGLKFMDDVPFREVYITGLIRDAEGQKMSKSKGNILDPLDLIDGISLDALLEKRTSGLMQPQLKPAIEKATRRQFPDGISAHGTDALRFTLAALASPSRDINFDMGRLEGYRNFCNKLWNGCRYALMNLEDFRSGSDDPASRSLADRWIRSRLAHTTQVVHEAFASYRLDQAARALYEFTWHELCDWYLELAKPVLQKDGESAERIAAQATLVSVFEALLRLMHPIMPFITEALFGRFAMHAGKRSASIMLEPLPGPGEFTKDAEAEREMAWLQSFILGIRQIRGEMDIAPGRALPVVIEDAGSGDRERIGRYGDMLRQIARLERIEILDPGSPPPAGSAVAVLGQLKVHVPLAGLIDVAAEVARLDRQRVKVSADLARSEAKLANPGFRDRAPAEVVAKEQARTEEWHTLMRELEQQIARLRDIG
ncbi:MAG: valine--tRNA ligase [Gammaproteobacteria bacterium]|nr:valine--tRNA ligase [Gammaproteobacteria bacterium]